jgi:hypothetical protein
VGVLLSGVWLIAFGFKSAGESLAQMGHALVMTAGIWLGCMTIVAWLWRKFPGNSTLPGTWSWRSC